LHELRELRQLREENLERDRSRPHVRQAHFAGGALKKGLKPAKRRELAREARQAYQLSDRRACGLMRITCWSNLYQNVSHVLDVESAELPFQMVGENLGLTLVFEARNQRVY
jgi:hypothetical protein